MNLKTISELDTGLGREGGGGSNTLNSFVFPGSCGLSRSFGDWRWRTSAPPSVPAQPPQSGCRQMALTMGRFITVSDERGLESLHMLQRKSRVLKSVCHPLVLGPRASLLASL